MQQREIKFRVWNIENNKMTSWKDLLKAKSHLVLNWLHRNKSEEKNIIMQYTWLKDKNGTEIYEGDVIMWKWYREVIFHKGCFCVAYLEDDSDPLWRNTYHIFDYETCEVQGNIHQNPELLNINS